MEKKRGGYLVPLTFRKLFKFRLLQRHIYSVTASPWQGWKRKLFLHSCKCVFHYWTTPSVVHYELIWSINLIIIFDQCNYIALYLLRVFICSVATLPYTHSANPACHSFLWEILEGEFPHGKGYQAFQRGLLGESSRWIVTALTRSWDEGQVHVNCLSSAWLSPAPRLLSLSSLGQSFPTHSQAACPIIMPSRILVGSTQLPPPIDGVTRGPDRKHALLNQGHSKSVRGYVDPQQILDWCMKQTGIVTL